MALSGEKGKSKNAMDNLSGAYITDSHELSNHKTNTKYVIFGELGEDEMISRPKKLVLEKGYMTITMIV